MLPQPVEELGREQRGYLEKLVSEDQGGHGGVEPAGVTPRKREGQEGMLGSTGIHLPINNLSLAFRSIPRASAAVYVPPRIQPQHLGPGSKFGCGWT